MTAAMVADARAHAKRPDHKAWCSSCVRNVERLAEALRRERAALAGTGGPE